MAAHVVPMYQALSKGSSEISIVNDVEDENKKGSESEDSELKLLHNSLEQSFFNLIKDYKLVNYYSKNYPSFYPKLISPPPEFLV